jgi:cell division septation protein DedD
MPSEPEAAPPADPALKPGEIHFSDKKEEVVPPSEPSADGKETAPQKDDLTFFKTLKDKKEGNVALRPKKEKVAKPKSAPHAVKASMKPAATHSGLAGHFAIQVASFSEKKGADTLAQKLKKKGFNSYVVAGEVPQKGRWYRVRVGSYPNRAEAKKVGDRLHESERLNFFVLSD